MAATRIDASILEEIKYRNDIEDVVSSYVKLNRSGSNMTGLCPFHSEKSPSFTVFTTDKHFYCFGCGAGGDVVTFIQKIENLDFMSAVEFLAKRASITLPETGAENTGVLRRRILDMNRDAAKFFHEMLLKNKAALEYLTGRGMFPALIKRFGLGYSPAGFGALTEHMHRLGYTDEELTSGFLCGVSAKTGRAYDYFRNRIMFPIIDVSGEVIAFGGRVTDDSMPKYLNSSDTPAFKKSRNLFALNFAKNACSESMILCEGYMDVIALHGAGFGNAVATLGTAITADQARLMKRYTKSVIISYDNDEAGQRASEKAFRLLEEAGLQTRILRMEGAKDPDEYIKRFGRDRFKRLLEGSVTQFDFRFSNILKKYDLNQTDDKIKAAEETVRFIATVSSAVERELYTAKTAETLELPQESIQSDVERQRKKYRRELAKSEREQLLRTSEGFGDRINPDAVKNVGAAKAEEAILGILLLYPELAAEIQNGALSLSASCFATEFNRRVYEAIMEQINKGGVFDYGLLGNEFSEDEMGRITKMRLERSVLSVNDRHVLTDLIQRLKEQNDKNNMGIEEIVNVRRSKNAGYSD